MFNNKSTGEIVQTQYKELMKRGLPLTNFS